jgi:hypothetical protein
MLGIMNIIALFILFIISTSAADIFTPQDARKPCIAIEIDNNNSVMFSNPAITDKIENGVYHYTRFDVARSINIINSLDNESGTISIIFPKRINLNTEEVEKICDEYKSKTKCRVLGILAGNTLVQNIIYDK